MKFNLQEVVNRYESPDRFYHRWSHITRMFSDARSLDVSLTRQQILAVIFHDIVYDSKSSTNEEDSANMMIQMVMVTNPEDEKIVTQAWYLIQDTKDHCPFLCPTYSPIVLDLDLMGLADSFEKYMVTSSLIRREYSFASDEQWRQGRSAFLTKMLEKKVIFNTEEVITKCEKLARRNLEEELKLLSK